MAKRKFTAAELKEAARQLGKKGGRATARKKAAIKKNKAKRSKATGMGYGKKRR